MRILINASTSIGDSLYFSFMLENIHSLYPKASLQIMCWTPMVSFYKSFPFIEQVIPYDTVKKDTMFAFFILKPKVDLYIDLQHTEESAQVAKLTGAKEIIGVNPIAGTESFYTHVISPGPDEQLKACFLRGFRSYWPQADIREDMDLYFSDQHEKQALSILIENGVLPDMPFVIIHPGAKGKEKLWDNKKWAIIALHLLKAGFKVVLIGSHLRGWGGAQIFDAHNCEVINALTGGRCINLSGKTPDFMVLASVIKRASLYFGLDTGPTHLACMLKVPVVELYKFIDAPTLSLWKPYGGEVRFLQNDDMSNIEVRDVIQIMNQEPVLVPLK